LIDVFFPEDRAENRFASSGTLDPSPSGISLS
jgi:hypothetical protein